MAQKPLFAILSWLLGNTYLSKPEIGLKVEGYALLIKWGWHSILIASTCTVEPTVKERRSPPKSTTPPTQFDQVRAALEKRFVTVSCTNLLGGLSPQGILDCLLADREGLGLTPVKSVIYDTEITALIGRMPGCAKPICLLRSPSELLIAASSTADRDCAEHLVHESCRIAVLKALSLHDVWANSLAELQHVNEIMTLQRIIERLNGID